MTNGKPPAPPRVSDVEEHWARPPQEMSARCAWWLKRIDEGWRPGRRLRTLGYYSSAEYYGVYIWEYLRAIRPLLQREENPGIDLSV